jgi:hypothetical protein
MDNAVSREIAKGQSQYEADPEELARREVDADAQERRELAKEALEHWSELAHLLRKLDPRPLGLVKASTVIGQWLLEIRENG